MTNPHAQNNVVNGVTKTIDGEVRVYYDGYWIKHYNFPDTLYYKKELIDILTKRVFHHTEPGINTPGSRLEEVREAYENTDDPPKKRVLAAMLAGALLNRGSDILTKVVELEEMGITIKSSNELMRECGRCFLGALEYGKFIRPRYGEEGSDELWGEPFKAFTMSLDKYLESRYIKIAQTMLAIDTIVEKLITMFENVEMFPGVSGKLQELAQSGKLATETRRRDLATIEIWPRFVAATDHIASIEAIVPKGSSRRIYTMCRRGETLIKDGTKLVSFLVNKRVPMPKTTDVFLKRCDDFTDKHLSSLIINTTSATS